MPAVLVSAIAIGSTWAALTSWRRFVTYPATYLLLSAAVSVVLVLLTAVLPDRFPRRLRVLLDLVLCIGVAWWAAAGTLVPFHAHAAAVGLHGAVHSVSTYRLPIEDTVASVTPLLVLGSMLFLFLAQLLAVHLRRPMLAGLPLLAVFALHAGFTGLGSAVVAFVVAAAGYLVLVLLDGGEARRHWGRPEDLPAADTAGVRALLRPAIPLGAVGIAAALVVAAVVPLPSTPLVNLAGPGRSKVVIHKPIVDMRGDLERNADVPLVYITTDQPDPGYLRIAVLNRFTGIEWSSGDRSVSPDRSADGTVPTSPGLSAEVPYTAYTQQAQTMPAFDSTWLPTAFPISRIVAPGDWRYDPATMDFVAAGSTNAADTAYTMTTEQPDYGTDGRWFQDAPNGTYPAEDLYVPGSVSTYVRDLAAQVTGGAKDDYHKALLLQDFFRATGHFRYSIHLAPRGTDGQTLDTFLQPGRGGRVGYCQQFASAMALMARILGVPARVAVGFLTPAPLGNHQYVYSSHDLHAWPELYFAGAGWVRFEPTPSSRAPNAPAYSTVPVTPPPNLGGPSGGPTSRPTSTTTAQPSSSPGSQPGSSKPQVLPGQNSGAQGGHTTVRVLGMLAAVPLAVAVLLAVVAGVRRRRRVRRLAGDADAIWAELRATAIDLSVAWPAGRSPRETGRRIAAHLTKGGRRVTPEVLAALDDLVLSVEELRYGSHERSVAVAARQDLGARASIVVAALEETATPRQLRRARWLPRSLRG
ncbi:MAG TPA: DUF3488 and transglutaminase-like domain-containing protein [Nocardioides sp.]|nr:DUF3488 and transglutaminase-like domain-containing protein [Nocardioides sp.]